MFLFIFIFSALILNSLDGLSTRNERNINYYKQLWDSNVEAARNYIRPEYNEPFKYYERDNCRPLEDDFDFVIVGGGSAGSVLARRLSEVFSWKILLLEAGGDENKFSQIPGAFYAVHNSSMNWGYLTEPQKYVCAGEENNRCDFIRGKVLGGCSSVNAMLHVRGNKNDWDEIGIEGWSYQEVLAYFKKSERITFFGDARYRGFTGNLEISYNEPTPPLIDSIILANQELGFKEIDYNAKQQIGVAKLQRMFKNGRRFSANQAYLQPVLTRPNLKVITEAFVTRLTFDGPKTTGVEFLHEGTCFSVKTNKEVLVAAGAVNSPQLLILSGIGPKEEFERIDIEPIQYLPVGKNLHNHFALYDIDVSTNFTYSVPDLHEALYEYLNGRSGPLTYISGLAVNFFKMSNASLTPHIEIFYMLPVNYVKQPYGHECNSMKLQIVLLHPKSRGSVKLKSIDPLDFPGIDPNYLEAEEDFVQLMSSISYVGDLLETEAFRKINATLLRVPIDECLTLENEAYWRCVIKYKASGMNHAAGTCSMGNDPLNSVVDGKLVVHGFENLRVIDASVLPTTTSGHLDSVIIMVAEKASDDIKIKYKEF